MHWSDFYYIEKPDGSAYVLLKDKQNHNVIMPFATEEEAAEIAQQHVNRAAEQIEKILLVNKN